MQARRFPSITSYWRWARAIRCPQTECVSFFIQSPLVLLFTSAVGVHDDFLTVLTSWPLQPHSVVNCVNFREVLERHKDLERARRVCVVGGGPVGIEVAGEIASRFPDTKVRETVLLFVVLWLVRALVMRGPPLKSSHDI